MYQKQIPLRKVIDMLHCGYFLYYCRFGCMVAGKKIVFLRQVKITYMVPGILRSRETRGTVDQKKFIIMRRVD